MSEPHLMPQDATNAVLIGCLTRLDWTPEQFAYHLNQLGRALRPAVPPIHPKTPGAGWLRVRPAARPASRAGPGPDWCAHCSHAISRNR